MSSLTFYSAMRLMDSGVTCTILFAYPVMTAAIMVFFFRERLTWATVGSIALATLGIAIISLMDKPPAGKGVNALGVGLTLLSGLAYAIYIVVVNRSRQKLPLATMNFWVCVFCALCLVLWSAAEVGGAAFVWPHSARAWFYAWFLALVPALLSLVLMAVSSQRVGATPTAILGALDPLTAVLVGVLVFGEPFTFTLALGIVLILGGVMLILARKVS